VTAVAQQCSFCRRHVANVHKIIAGPDASICNDCVQLCHEILIENGTLPPARVLDQRSGWLRRVLRA
jgi:ATP-dependent Clp protease ATP-binding subunit ClpX